MVVEDKRKRLIMAMIVLLAAIMQILDTTIVTVALPHMQGQLSANIDEINWVLTSYLISAGIFMPLTGFLTDRLGQRTYLLWSTAGFTVASMLCGLATSLDQIVFFRLLQGIAGAGLVPSAQAVLVDIYPEDERGKAMAIFGVGAMFGPIMGPTLGGYLTQVLDWRWTFFINLPVGIVAMIGIWMMIPETERKDRRTDWIGFLFLAVAVASMQFVFDRGQQLGWFGSLTIQVMTVTSIFGYLCLILRNHEMGRDAVFDLSIFKDRNYSVSALILAVFMFSLYGVLALQPQMLERFMGYPTFTTGLALAPRGIASMVAMFLAGRLINRVGAKPLIVLGIGLTILGTVAMTWYPLQIDLWWVIWPVVVQGFGLGFVFVPLATVTFATLPKRQSAEAAGVRQIARTIGAGLGVAVSGAIMAREGQAAWNQLGGHITASSQALHDQLGALGLSIHSPLVWAMIGRQIDLQSNFIGLIDAFWMLGWGMAVGLPLLLLLSKGVGRTNGGKRPATGTKT